MVTKSTAHRRAPPPGGTIVTTLRLVLRGLQVFVALVVMGLYAHSVRQRQQGQFATHPSAYSAAAYGVAVSVLSIAVAAAWSVPGVRSWRFFAVDTVLVVLWLALFGTFARDWVNGNDGYGAEGNRMRVAVWFDLAGALLWFATAAGSYPPFNPNTCEEESTS